MALPPALTTASERPGELRATLVWATGEQVYLVHEPGERIVPGDVLEFEYRKKIIATARVTSRAEAVVVATVLAGSFERAKKRLAKVRVFARPAPPLEGPPLLRVGFPSPLRTNLIFDCAATHPPFERPPSLFHIEAASPEGYRLVRVGEPNGVPWPDTLAIRWFDEVADQEIALERGDLDVAVFWPGELTDRMRDPERWGFTYGERTRGVIAAMWHESGAGRNARDAEASAEVPSGSESPHDPPLRFAGSARLADLNQQLFRGDLAPWPRTRGDAPFEPSVHPLVASGDAEAARFSVDMSFPGWRAIERFLNHGATSDAPVVRIAYLDEPPDGMAPHLAGDMRVEPLYVVRCPLVWARERTGVIEAIGASAWIELLDCEPASHGP